MRLEEVKGLPRATQVRQRARPVLLSPSCPGLVVGSTPIALTVELSQILLEES